MTVRLEDLREQRSTLREKDFYAALLVEVIGRVEILRQQLNANGINPRGQFGIDAEDIADAVDDAYRVIQEEQ